MRRVADGTSVVVVMFVALTCAAVYVMLPAAARPAVSCAPQTAWAGTETSQQHNDGTFITIPVQQDITVIRVQASVAYAQRPVSAPGFSELLFLIGTVNGPLVLSSDPELPVLPPDQALGAWTVTSRSPHNQNPAFADGVIAARILKSNTGSASAMVDTTVDVPVSAGGTVWLRYDSQSQYVLDPEVQLLVTWKPAGC